MEVPREHFSSSDVQTSHLELPLTRRFRIQKPKSGPRHLHFDLLPNHYHPPPSWAPATLSTLPQSFLHLPFPPRQPSNRNFYWHRPLSEKRGFEGSTCQRRELLRLPKHLHRPPEGLWQEDGSGSLVCRANYALFKI